jgi:hypothetical protein
VKGKKIIVITVLFLALAIPATLTLLKQQTDFNSKAAAPDALEAEGGTLNSNVQVVTDSTASGGSFIRLNTASAPTPTASPNPSIPPDAIYVPSSIDATGSRDVQVELNNFINNTPDDSTIVFKQGGTYQLTKLLWLRGRNNLTFEGNGATFRLTDGGQTPWWNSGMHIDANSANITVRNLKIIGNHSAAGTPQACCSREGQRGIGVFGSKNILLENLDISYVGGDCFTLGIYSNGNIWSDGVTVRNSRCTLTGRMGMHTIASSNVVFENNYFNQIGYAVFSSEPNGSLEGIRNLIIKNNKVGSYSLTNNYEGALYYYADATWSDGPTDMSGITITGNTVEGNISGKNGVMMGLNVKIYDNGTGLRENVTVTNNIAKKAVSGPVMRFETVKGVTVTGNDQPLTSGSLSTFLNCTNIINN